MQFHHLYMLMKYAHNYSHYRIKDIRISDTEHLMCIFLIGHLNSSQDQISEHLQIDKATIAKALMSLESKGYIARKTDPDNRRKNIINITDLGYKVILPVADIYASWLEKITDTLTAEELEQFSSNFIKILDSAKKLNQEI